MNLNATKIVGILIVVVSVLAVSTTQLTTIFGQASADKIVALAIMLNAILGGVVTVIGGPRPPTQDQQVREVLEMPGVERIDVNEQANKTLASLAMDKTVNKIGPTIGAAGAVAKTAKGA